MIRTAFFPPIHLNDQVRNYSYEYLDKVEKLFIPLLKKAITEGEIGSTIDEYHATVAFMGVVDGIFVESLYGGTERVQKRLDTSWIVHNDENVLIDVIVEKKERTHLTIKDNGKGIEIKELDKIFDRYYRGTNTGDAHKGSGLGMAIAKDIIQEHNGELTITSEIGHGTTIVIKF
jgi:light-regulated signal transduction histidine kinase (bacteriophytochrome)